MDKIYYENGVHGEAKASSSLVNLGAMLDNTESASYHQVYEYFQGPFSHPDNIEQSEGEGGFSNDFPSYLTCSSTLQAGPLPSQSIHEKTIQAAFTNEFSLRDPNASLFNSGRDETRITQYTSNTGTRKSNAGHLTINGSSVQSQLQLLPSRNYLPHQQHFSGDHQPGFDIESKIFLAPAPPKLDYISKSDNSHASRECSGYETSCSPNNQKITDHELLSPQLGTIRGLKSHRIGSGQQMKFKRSPDKSEHIFRERQRRDDMSSKFLMLESLLPPWPKNRDRSTIVDHSVAHVKSLYERVKNLKEKRLEILRSNAYSLSGVQIKGTPKQEKHKQNSSAAYNHEPSPDLRRKIFHVAFLKSSALCKESGLNSFVKEKCIDRIEVHMDWPNQIVIEMTCRPHPHIQSQIMKEMERLELDVSSCSITKLHIYLICVIVLKPRVVKELPITRDDVMEGLKRAITAQDS